MAHKVTTSRLAAVMFAAALVAAACSSTTSSTSAGSTDDTGGARGTTAAGGLQFGPQPQTAQAATQLAFKGTNRDVDPTPRPAAKGKHIVVISAGQAASSSSVPSNAAVDAAKKIGWQVDLYDAMLMPSNYTPLIRQAIAANADGIILDAIDCQAAKQAMQEARDKGIALVAIYGFDCNDPAAGAEPTGLYSANINFGKNATDPDAFAESYGADQANYIIADSNNTAKIITINDPEFTVLHWTLEGFNSSIQHSNGSQIVDNLDVTTQDLTNGQIVPKIQAELLKHPEATWIKSPYTYVTTLGIVPALGDKAGQIKVMGGEGFAPELDLIRTSKITAANAISSGWVGWASIDTMNSVFNKQPPADSGIGWTMIDAQHNLPPNPGSEFVPPVDYMGEYAKVWGVG
jgi:ribose transport system substrate-binding protein